MVIISKAILQRFAKTYPDSKDALEKWYDDVKNANWRNFAELKNTFNSADSVGNDKYVFNIRGNKYRLIARVIFKTRTIFILFVGTHGQYDKIEASKVTFKK